MDIQQILLFSTISTSDSIENEFFPTFPIFEDEFDHALDLLEYSLPRPTLFDEFETITDLIQIEKTPFRTSTRRISHRVGLGELYLQTLCNRVSDLELGLERLVREEKARKKCTWTAEIESPGKQQKYNWTARIKGEKKGFFIFSRIRVRPAGWVGYLDSSNGSGSVRRSDRRLAL